MEYLNVISELLENFKPTKISESSRLAVMRENLRKARKHARLMEERLKTLNSLYLDFGNQYEFTNIEEVIDKIIFDIKQEIAYLNQIQYKPSFLHFLPTHYKDFYFQKEEVFFHGNKWVALLWDDRKEIALRK